jgi:hypothetical protein
MEPVGGVETMMLRCLSVQQPFAWAIIKGHKPVENRTWSSRYYGRLLIHASKTYDKTGHLWIEKHFPELSIPAMVPVGQIVGEVEMVECVRSHPSKWFVGPFGFVLKNPLEYGIPILYRGQLGIFDVPETVIRGRK